MFLIGKKIPKQKGKIFGLCALNLIILPTITYIIGRAYGLEGIPFKVTTLQAAMPLAATTFVLAQKYKIAEEIVSSAIVVSTIVSIITLGGIMYLFETALFL